MSDFYLDKWAGEFGDKYTERCNVDAKKRQPIFKQILSNLYIENALEIGCNKGHNLEAISADSFAKCYGIEPNRSLCNKPNIINGNAYNIPFNDDVFRMVFTSGVLIHIPSEKLSQAMSEMYRVSNKYIMMIEYPAEKEIGQNYRDFGGAEGVWARPYGEIFQKQFPSAKLIKKGSIKDHGNDGWGFTDCDYWIFQKVS